MHQPTITCKNCGNHFHGKYCNLCGEKVYGEKDKSLWHIFEELFHFISHFEGNFFVTLKTIFTKPGKFSLDYCNGIRRKYFKPISFFLLIVVLYLIFPFARGLNLRLSDHLDFWYGNYARQLVRTLMAEKHLGETAVFEGYSTLSEKVSKFLLFLLIPVMAAFSAIFTLKSKRPFFDHLIFSTETTSFFILWGFLILPLIIKIIGAFTDALNGETDTFTVPIIILVTAVFVFFSGRRFYSFTNGKAILFSILFLTVLPIFTHYIYSFILFFITIHLLH